MRQIHNEQELQEIIEQAKPAIIVFKTTWCKDCHYIEPFMPEVIQQNEAKIDFFQVDRDELPDVCDKYHIMGIPSFVAFKEGQELIRFVNKLQKSRTEIEQFVERAIQVSETIAK
jgi:thioredoxin-like negative regulator of GroEL